MIQVSRYLEEKVAFNLIASGLVDMDAVKSVISDTAEDNSSIFSALIDRGITTEETIIHALANVQGVPYVDLTNAKLDQDTLLKLPMEVAQKQKAVAIGEEDGKLLIAMLNPADVQAVDYLSTLTKKPIRAFMASSAGLENILDQYREDFSHVDTAVKVANQEEAARAAASELDTITQDSPISKALDTILEYAVKTKASDIHIEPTEAELRIRCRIDGVLRVVMTLPRTIEAALISRIKILANLKIDEQRMPQDGQFTVKIEDKEIDLRVATSPVIWGEQAIIRLLDKNSGLLGIESMGLVGRALTTVREGINRPNGMILTSGPTGSGKTTTMYALIQEIKKDSLNIVTLEDPVEYKISGVNQIQVNVEAGLTFSSGLRSILRQDPDVIMVGEIRDRETANLAVQAALTGHLVFSTLHTNSAAGILPRLLDMGIEPFLLASTLNTVIGQRLVRRVAPERDTYRSDSLQTQEIHSIVGNILPETAEEVKSVSEALGYEKLPLANQSAYDLVKGLDSAEAPGGYSGRTGIFEAMAVDEDVQKMIVGRATAGEIQRTSMLKGMVSVHQDGILKALSGTTTIEEVNRVASDVA